MAYSFVGFMGTLEPVQSICRRFIFAKGVPLGQELFLIPMTEELQDQINGAGASVVADGFEYLTEQIESVARAASALGPLAYAEVTSWAGDTNEAGLLWQQGDRVRTIRFGKGVLNTLLKSLGCVPDEGYDEFTTLGFGLRRFTDDWVSE